MARIGVIGLGFMGRMHIAAYQKISGAQVVAIADKDPQRASGDFSSGWGNVSGAATTMNMNGVLGTTDFNELLRMKEVDIVDICLPTPFHEEFAKKAVKKGKHVLCEKPLALSSGEATRIAKAAAKAKGFFMPAMCMRFWPQWAWIKQAVVENRYGKVTDASFSRLASMPPGWFADGKISGGGILDLHVHDTDFVYYLLGKPDAVFSRGNIGVSGAIDHITTQYIYEGGPSVTAEGSWTRTEGFPFTMRATVGFEKATVIFDISAPKPLLLCQDKKAEPIEMVGDGYEVELAYFVNCVNTNTRPTIVTAEDAVMGLKIVEAERKSIETGRIVKVAGAKPATAGV